VELDWLQTFVVAAETANFHKAAEILHLAQPTVSLHIQKLEQQLGIALFERKGRQVRVSAAGRRYLSHARQVLDALETSREDMLRWRQGYEETVKIAVSPLVATTLLPRWIQHYSKEHPTTEFAVLVRESADLLQAVLGGECDLGFSRLAVKHPEVECVALYSDPIVLAAPADGRDFESPPVSVSELFAEYPVFTHNHPEYWDALTVSLRRSYPAVRTMRISQVHVTIHWIVEKMGVSFLPASTVQRELLRGTVVEVPFDDFPLPVAATYLLIRSGDMPVAVRTFSEYVQNYMNERTLGAL
jgi:LysR family transcriptional regulator, repressor for citA